MLLVNIVDSKLQYGIITESKSQNTKGQKYCTGARPCCVIKYDATKTLAENL